MKLLSVILLGSFLSPAAGFGDMHGDWPKDDCHEAWCSYDYPDLPKPENCIDGGAGKYDYIDASVGAWACTKASGDREACQAIGKCFFHEEWQSCMPACNVDVSDSPGADNCFACSFDAAWAGFPLSDSEERPEGWLPGPCPGHCSKHRGGVCGLPCSTESDNPFNPYGCYFCADETCGGSESCQWYEEEGQCQPGCSSNNCDPCSWDECGCTEGCDWNKRDNHDGKWPEPGRCDRGCSAGNCWMCDPDQKGDRTQCDTAPGCIWNDSAGPWDEIASKPLGECVPGCNPDDCWSCNEHLYGEAGKDKCVEAGCQVVDYSSLDYWDCRRKCEDAVEHHDFHSCASAESCTSNGGTWYPDRGVCDGSTCFGECHGPCQSDMCHNCMEESACSGSGCQWSAEWGSCS